jgi:uncharacterized protein YndB with AHSA1/START domain
MSNLPAPVRIPDLASRPFNLTVKHQFPFPASALYAAWTERFDLWFAAPGSVLMQPVVNAPFFFETEYKPENQSSAQRHPHYGRFLQLVPQQLVQLTWVTGAGGTEGAETVVTVELQSHDTGCHMTLTHAGFPNADARDRHQQAWPIVLEQMELRLAEG